MKKLVIKIAIITLGIILVLAVSVFGIVSFCAPKTMMELTHSLGLEVISGDYAYQEYQSSNDISYLARSFEIAAENQKDSVAESRFDELFMHEDFSSYCEEQDKTAADYAPEISYRNYIVSLGVCVKYRNARTDDEKETIYLFACNETDLSFPSGNPVLMLSVEAAGADDEVFCSYLLNSIPLEGFEENRYYNSMINLLEEVTENE